MRTATCLFLSLGMIAACQMSATSFPFPAGSAEVKFELPYQRTEEVFADPKAASLADAACRGNARAVKRMVDEGADPNARGLHGFSPLFWALHCRDIAGVAALLDAGADPNHTDDFFVSPILVSSTMLDIRFLEAMVTHGGNVNFIVAEAARKSGVDPEYNFLGSVIYEEQPPYKVLRDAVYDNAVFLDRNDGNRAWRRLDFLIRSGLDLNVSTNPHEPEFSQLTLTEDLLLFNDFCKGLEILKLGARKNLPPIRIATEESLITAESDASRYKCLIEMRTMMRSLVSDAELEEWREKRRNLPSPFSAEQ